MKNSAQGIRAGHVGRLPVPSGFEQTALRLARGEVGGEEVAAQVVPVVADVVKRQVEIGLDCIGDGEYWSALDINAQSPPERQPALAGNPSLCLTTTGPFRVAPPGR
jgi:hypothetical protein